MGHARGIRLLTNKDVVSPGDEFLWEGGRSVLIVSAASFPTTLQLQLKFVTGNFVNASSNITTAGVSESLDLPAGTYRMNLSGGTATDVYVNLVRVMQ